MLEILYIILTYSNIILWIIAGIIILGSNYYDFNIINCIVGLLLLLISSFWYKKYKSIINLMVEVKKNFSQFNSLEMKLQNLLKYEFMLIVISLLLVLIINSGVFTRVFGEQMSVFG
jgi:hypothetical protein